MYTNTCDIMPKGFLFSGVHCGIRKNKTKKDLALIYSQVPAAAAALYTQNIVKGAPVTVTKEHIKNGKAQAIICNSGIANTSAADAVKTAKSMCELTAASLSLSAEDVIVASTGVIGKPLPIEPIRTAMPALKNALCHHDSDAAVAIMTTDTVKKTTARSLSIGGKTVSIRIMAKGSGMIHPNMATLLCFVTTDANISQQMLLSALTDAVANSLNMVSIDGDTSTNDMIAALANGMAENPKITEKSKDYHLFKDALFDGLKDISRMIAKDGEGAARLLECTVKGASSLSDARILAKSVISSSLVKTAFFGADANFGRILCALGYAGPIFSPEKTDITLSSSAGNIAVCKNGEGLLFDEKAAKKILLMDTIYIDINLNMGGETATAYGCDLTYDYIKINGDYRS